MYIQLWDSVDSAIIIKNINGPLYINQVGGTACLHKQINGFLAPLKNDIWEESGIYFGMASELNKYFIGPKWKGSGAFRGIDIDDADVIDSIFDHYELYSIRVNRVMLKDSYESWVHVNITGDESGDIDLSIFKLYYYPAEAVLTWPNSD